MSDYFIGGKKVFKKITPSVLLILWWYHLVQSLAIGWKTNSPCLQLRSPVSGTLTCFPQQYNRKPLKKMKEFQNVHIQVLINQFKVVFSHTLHSIWRKQLFTLRSYICLWTFDPGVMPIPGPTCNLLFLKCCSCQALEFQNQSCWTIWRPLHLLRIQRQYVWYNWHFLYQLNSQSINGLQLDLKSCFSTSFIATCPMTNIPP